MGLICTLKSIRDGACGSAGLGAGTQDAPHRTPDSSAATIAFTSMAASWHYIKIRWPPVRRADGAPIRGSWWAHPKAHEIFRILEAVSDRSDILVCRLVDGKVTYIHRRIW